MNKWMDIQTQIIFYDTDVGLQISLLLKTYKKPLKLKKWIILPTVQYKKSPSTLNPKLEFGWLALNGQQAI